jgi:hypothetical protein
MLARPSSIHSPIPGYSTRLGIDRALRSPWAYLTLKLRPATSGSKLFCEIAMLFVVLQEFLEEAD